MLSKTQLDSVVCHPQLELGFGVTGHGSRFSDFGWAGSVQESTSLTRFLLYITYRLKALRRGGGEVGGGEERENTEV